MGVEGKGFETLVASITCGPYLISLIWDSCICLIPISLNSLWLMNLSCIYFDEFIKLSWICLILVFMNSLELYESIPYRLLWILRVFMNLYCIDFYKFVNPFLSILILFAFNSICNLLRMFHEFMPTYFTWTWFWFLVTCSDLNRSINTTLSCSLTTLILIFYFKSMFTYSLLWSPYACTSHL